MRCPYCEIVMKGGEVIKDWFNFWECQSCGTLIIEKIIDPEENTYVFISQDEFESFDEAKKAHTSLQQLDLSSWDEIKGTLECKDCKRKTKKLYGDGVCAKCRKEYNSKGDKK